MYHSTFKGEKIAGKSYFRYFMSSEFTETTFNHPHVCSKDPSDTAETLLRLYIDSNKNPLRVYWESTET